MCTCGNLGRQVTTHSVVKSLPDQRANLPGAASSRANRPPGRHKAQRASRAGPAGGFASRASQVKLDPAKLRVITCRAADWTKRAAGGGEINPAGQSLSFGLNGWPAGSPTKWASFYYYRPANGRRPGDSRGRRPAGRSSTTGRPSKLLASGRPTVRLEHPQRVFGPSPRRLPASSRASGKLLPPRRRACKAGPLNRR